MQGPGLLVAHRQDPAGVVEAVVSAGQFLEVPRDAVRLAQVRGAGDDPGELADGADEGALAVLDQQCQVRALRGDPEVGRVTRERTQTGVRVLNVEDGIVVGRRRPQLQVDVHGLVDRGADQRVARGVDTDRVHEVVERDDRARPLAHLHRFAVAHEVDHLADEHLDRRRVVAQRRGGRLESCDVPVMVGAQHVDAQVESTLALVEEVGDVAGDVGGVAVGLEDDTVLVVPERGGTQPPRALGLVQVAVALERLDRPVNGARGEHGVLMGIDVKDGAELGERVLDVGEHQVDPGRAEGLQRLVLRHVEDTRMRGHHLRGDVLDVGPGVPVLRGLLPTCSSGQRAAEPVDLGTVVVEVVLAGDLGSGGLQDAAERVTDGRPPGAAQVDGAGGVRGDELEIDPSAGHRVAVAVPLPLLEHGGDERALRTGVEPDVEETGTGDLRRCDARILRQRVRERLCEVPRCGPDLLGQLQRDIGRVVAVFGVAGPLDGHRLRNDRRVGAALGENGDEGGADDGGEVGGSHVCPS